MGLDRIISRLSGVKQTGPQRWIARCPAHDDRSPSLTVRQLEDGRILAHCFAGCEVGAVLAALGLRMGDLFPAPLAREQNFLPRIRAPFNAHEALACLASESAVVAIAASDAALGKPLNPTDADRVALAAGRIASALEVAHGR
jgi:hypothetical protein